jgi:VanZ family protein
MKRATFLPAPPRLRHLGLWGLWLLALTLWTACLLTTAPAHATAKMLAPEPDYVVTNIGHVLAYALLAGALVWLPGRKKGWAVVLLSLHAMGTEVGQQWVPERTADLLDVALDHLGIAGGLLVAWWLVRLAGSSVGFFADSCDPEKEKRRTALLRGGAPRLRPSGEGAGSAGGPASLSR